MPRGRWPLPHSAELKINHVSNQFRRRSIDRREVVVVVENATEERRDLRASRDSPPTREQRRWARHRQWHQDPRSPLDRGSLRVACEPRGDRWKGPRSLSRAASLHVGPISSSHYEIGDDIWCRHRASGLQMIDVICQTAQTGERGVPAVTFAIRDASARHQLCRLERSRCLVPGGWVGGQSLCEQQRTHWAGTVLFLVERCCAERLDTRAGARVRQSLAAK